MKFFRTTFKKNLLAGLLIIIPAAFTFFLLSFVLTRIDHAWTPEILGFLQRVGVPISPVFALPGLGFFFILIFVLVIGVITTNFFGKKLVEIGNRIINNIPFVRTIYITIKRIVDAASMMERSFQKVVLMDYPREGLRGIGVVSCDAQGEMAEKFSDDMVCVFVPTTPNPTTGFTVLLPREKITPLSFPVDKGFKMIVSVGMYNAGGENKGESENF